MNAEDYKKLILDFLKHSNPKELDETFSKAFMAEPGGMDDKLFDILSDFWRCSEDYDAEWTESEEFKEFINLDMLIECAKDTVQRLDVYIMSNKEVTRKVIIAERRGLSLLLSKINSFLEEWFGEPSGE